MKKVTMKVAGEAISLKGPEAAKVTVETTEKQIFSRTVQHARGGTQDPLSEDELFVKFQRCAEYVLKGRRIDAIKEAVLGIESLTNISELARLLATEG